MKEFLVVVDVWVMIGIVREYRKYRKSGDDFFDKITEFRDDFSHFA